MNYSEEQLNDTLKLVRNRFFLSGGMAALVGAVGLYFLKNEASEDLSHSAMLFCGFIVGFFVAGIVIPDGFKKQLKKGMKKGS